MDLMKWTTAFYLYIIEKFKGGPVGLTTIATAVGEEAGHAGRSVRTFFNTGRIFTAYATG